MGDPHMSNEETDQNPFQTDPPWKGLKSEDDFQKSYFKGEYAGKPHKNARSLEGHARLVKHWGSPFALKTATLWIDGCGKNFDHALKITVHANLKDTFQSVFDEIRRVNNRRYYFWYLGSHYARYIHKPEYIKAIVRDGEDFVAKEDVKAKKNIKKDGVIVHKKGDLIVAKGSVLYEKREYPSPPFIAKDARDNSKAHKNQWANKKGSGSWPHAAYEVDFKRGTVIENKVSNHSFGTAVDINPGRNDYEAGGPFDMPPWIVQIFLDHGFYWGGFYGDYMHFEYMQALGPAADGTVPSGGQSTGGGDPEAKDDDAAPAAPPPPPAPKRAPGETITIRSDSPHYRPLRAWSFPAAFVGADGKGALEAQEEELYQKNEAGRHGFFPLGAHNVWHGGIHLPGPCELRAIGDGTIVAARLAEQDPGAPYEGTTSRNFVLLRHELVGERGEERTVKALWSLYYHLKPFPLAAEDPLAASLPWLEPQLRGYRTDLAPGKRYFEVAVAEDPKEPDEGEKGDKEPYGLRLRAEPKSKGKILTVLPRGALVEVLEEPEKKGWAKVKLTGGTYVYEQDQVRVGARVGSDTSGKEGWLYTRQGRVVVVDTTRFQELDALRAAKVVALNVAVKAGEKLGEAGPLAGASGVHVETFSREPLDHIPELAGLRKFEDGDNDALVDVKELTELVDGYGVKFMADGKIDVPELQLKARELRDVAAFHVSEWAADDWSKLLRAPWNMAEAALKSQREAIKKQQWWELVKAVDTKQLGPPEPKLWHYHPAKLVGQLKRAFAPGGSQEQAGIPRETLDVAEHDPDSEPALIGTLQAGTPPMGGGNAPPVVKAPPSHVLPGGADPNPFYVLDTAKAVAHSVWEREWKKSYTSAYKQKWADNTPLDQIKVSESGGKPVVFSFRANLRVCSDGISPNVYGDTKVWKETLDKHGGDAKKAYDQFKKDAKDKGFKYWDKYKLHGTAFTWKGKPLNAEEIPYVVTPPQMRIGETGVEKGNLALVRVGTRSVFAINGESGPEFRAGEASMATCRLLGISEDPSSGGISGDEPADNRVDYIILVGSSYPASEALTAEGLQTHGRAAFEEAVRKGHLRHSPTAGGAWLLPMEPIGIDELDVHYARNEDGAEGFYPIGANRLWHGGVHLFAAGEVKACAAGTLIAARMTLKGEEQRPRGFALVRHDLHLRDGAHQVWSLYYHLAPEPVDGSSTVPWVDTLTEGYRAGLGEGIYLRIDTAEDKGGLNLRDDAKKVIAQIPRGTMVEQLGEKGELAKVSHAGKEGWVLTSGKRVTRFDGKVWKKVRELQAGSVVLLDIPVVVGELLGRVAKVLHFEIFSDEDKVLAPFSAGYQHVVDPDDDPVADAAELLARAGIDSDDVTKGGDADQVRAAAPKMRHYIVTHVSEWSPLVWDRLAEAPWHLLPEQILAAKAEAQAHQFWSALGKEGPRSPRITNYHPLAFVETMAAARKPTAALSPVTPQVPGHVPTQTAEAAPVEVDRRWLGLGDDEVSRIVGTAPLQAGPTSNLFGGGPGPGSGGGIGGGAAKEEVIYLDIKLGPTWHPEKKIKATATVPEKTIPGYSEAMTGKDHTVVYVPLGFSAPTVDGKLEVDVVFYLLGKNWDADLKAYLNRFPIDMALEAGGRHALLVAPRPGNGYQPGTLTGKGGFAKYLEQVLAALGKQARFSGQTLKLGQLVLSGHSAGGIYLNPIVVNLPAELIDKTRAIWLFDGVYGDMASWVDWFDKHPKVRAALAYTSHQAGNNEQIKSSLKRKDVVVVPAVFGGEPIPPKGPSYELGAHDETAPHYMTEWLRTADFFRPRTAGEFAHEYFCAKEGKIVVHDELQRAVHQTRLRAGLDFMVAGAICLEAPKLCPAPLRDKHKTGDAVHLTGVTRDGGDDFSMSRDRLRAAELAGLWGLDTTQISVKDEAAKALHVEPDKLVGKLARKDGTKLVPLVYPPGVRSIPTAAPWSGLSVVAVRSGKAPAHLHELHLHRGGTRIVEAQVDGKPWRCLPFVLAPGTGYLLHKKVWWQASLHRQWAQEATVKWTAGLCRFYKDHTGQLLGVGDLSHIAGGDMTDQGAHDSGLEVDVFPLGAGSPWPEAYSCAGAAGKLTVHTLKPSSPDPQSTSNPWPFYGGKDQALTGAAADRVFELHATVMAYALLTKSLVADFTWHGATDRGIQDQALALATAAQKKLQASWGKGESWMVGPADPLVRSIPAFKAGDSHQVHVKLRAL